MSGETQIQQASNSQREQIVDTLTLAFSGDPLMRWYFPTASDYLEWFPEFVTTYGGQALDNDGCFYIGDVCGATMWLPPGVTPPEEELIDLAQSALPTDKHLPTMTALGKITELKPDEPCWHLPFIGVEPTAQGRGYGSALLADGLQRCDDTGDRAYLESSNPRNLSLYLRHGFELIETVDVDPMPPIFLMVRDPVE